MLQAVPETAGDMHSDVFEKPLIQVHGSAEVVSEKVLPHRSFGDEKLVTQEASAHCLLFHGTVVEERMTKGHDTGTEGIFAEI